MKSFGSQSAPAPPLLEEDEEVLVPPELLVDVPASVPPELLLVLPLEDEEELLEDDVEDEDDLPESGVSPFEGGNGRMGSLVVVGTACAWPTSSVLDVPFAQANAKTETSQPAPTIPTALRIATHHMPHLGNASTRYPCRDVHVTSRRSHGR